MLKGEKLLVYKSKYENDHFLDVVQAKLGIEFFSKVEMIWIGYNIAGLLQSLYFEFLRVSDGKLTLSVQKYWNDDYKVTFSYKPQGNNLKVFTDE